MAAALEAAVTAQGEIVRKLKGTKADPEDIKAAVAKLVSLKQEVRFLFFVDCDVLAP